MKHGQPGQLTNLEVVPETSVKQVYVKIGQGEIPVEMLGGCQGQRSRNVCGTTVVSVDEQLVLSAQEATHVTSNKSYNLLEV